MTDALVKKSNTSLKERFLNSKIIRVTILLLLLVGYYLFVSPKIEYVISSSMSEFIRGKSQTQVNSLSPIFDIHVYASDYNLASYSSSTNTSSRTKFFTLDPRVLAMNKFLTDYHSPMAQNAEVFVTEAEIGRASCRERV